MLSRDVAEKVRRALAVTLRLSKNRPRLSDQVFQNGSVTPLLVSGARTVVATLAADAGHLVELAKQDELDKAGGSVPLGYASESRGAVE